MEAMRRKIMQLDAARRNPAPAVEVTDHRVPIQVISSDEEDDSHGPVPFKPLVNSNRNGPALKQTKLTSMMAPGIPIPVPYNPRPGQVVPSTNRYPSGPSKQVVHVIEDEDDGKDEVLKMPQFVETLQDQYMRPAEAEQALKDLFAGAINDDSDVQLTPDDLIVDGLKGDFKLLPHQVLGRTWMKERENASAKRFGGILADDMGLGKTIQTLVRIVEGRPKKSDRDDGWDAPTLVIAPLAVLQQWVDEITKMTSLTAVKHQGTSRKTDPNILKRAHVVVTTYDTVKSEFGAYTPEASKTTEKSKKATKKAPAKASSSLVVLSSDDESDKSIETFGRTLTKPATAGKVKVKKDALFHVKWWRVVLDEAHTIKNRKTQVCIACTALEAKFRWCLTGTPMQNDVSELFSLIQFLRIKPYSRWERFNEDIAKHVKEGKGANRAMKRLQAILKVIMLRRRKDQVINGKVLIELPPKTLEIVSCPFSVSEDMFYQNLSEKMDKVLDKLLQDNPGKNNYIAVIVLLLRLRQACNHPALVTKDYKDDVDSTDSPSSKKKADPTDDLVSALDRLTVTNTCAVCTTVLTTFNTADGNTSHCASCAPLAMEAQKQLRERPDSAKIRMILKLLQQIDDRSEGEDKTIIFSQFTSMLDLIEPFLKDKGIRFVRYDGSMPQPKREEALQMIKGSGSVRVILISFKAGSTGLNLTVCNNVILVDMWWNPALEEQAFDRAHRFGQKKAVNIYKLKVDGTVEDRILELQERKRELARAALSGDKAAGNRFNMADMLGLFNRGSGADVESD